MEHQQYKEYYVAVYFKDSWGKLPALLSREGLILFSGGRATARDLLKQRLKAFNVAFDDLYKKHAKWIIPDKELGAKIGHLAVQVILEKLKVNDRLERCLEIYVDVRGGNARESLDSLQLDYLQEEFISVLGKDEYTDQWTRHLEFAVKHLLDAEYKLCGDVLCGYLNSFVIMRH